MDEQLALARWIDSKVAGDTGAGGLMALSPPVAGAYMDIIPREVSLPAVKFVMLTPSDTRGATNASARVMVRIQTLIVVQMEGPGVGVLAPYSNRLDVLFQQASGTTADLRVLGCARLQPYLQRTLEEGRFYTAAGGIFMIHCQSLA